MPDQRLTLSGPTSFDGSVIQVNGPQIHALVVVTRAAGGGFQAELSVQELLLDLAVAEQDPPAPPPDEVIDLNAFRTRRNHSGEKGKP